MFKININKNDDLASTVEKIIEAQDSELTLIIPRFSTLSEADSNFRLLRREADAAEKKISIESVDEKVIKLAQKNGLKATNPFLSRSQRQFSDIVAPSVSSAGRGKTKKILNSPVLEVEKIEEDINKEFKNLHEDLERLTVQRRRGFKFNMPSFGFQSFFSKKILVNSLILVLIITSGYFAITKLPKAKILIIPETKAWEYKDSVMTDKAAAMDIGRMIIPNQVFSQKKSSQSTYLATGRKPVEKKAAGPIIVYNSYSSDPQKLVAQTRFTTPDGKIFRLAETITVPGAKISEGKIIPSNIATQVEADKAGPDYNIGPVKIFNIPGFKGTPKYQAFYAESIEGMVGGFIGEMAYPTSDDIKKGTVEANANLESDLKAVLMTQIPKEFKIIDGATRFKIIDQKIDKEADETGNFGISSTAQLSVVAFEQETLNSLLTKRAQKDNSDDFDVRSSTLDYGLIRVDFDRGLMSFPVDFKATLVKKINIEELKSKLLGKSEIDLKSTILGLNGVKSATISLWPFWVKHVPDSIDRIEIKVE